MNFPDTTFLCYIKIVTWSDYRVQWHRCLLRALICTKAGQHIYLLLGFKAGRTSVFLDLRYVGWPHLSSNAVDFYYRMYSFHFEIIKTRFKSKTFREISFLTETTLTHSLYGAIQYGHRSQNATCSAAQILLGFCITIHTLVLIRMNDWVQ